MSNINDLIIEIQGKIDIYKLKAENQRNKTAMCYEDNTLSYANWILGLHKDTPNTTKTVYLYKNVCEKNDGMYEEYLLLRPDKEIDEDGKTLRTHMANTSKEDQHEFANNKGLLEDGRNELDRLKGELNENETLRNEKATTSEQILETVKGEQQELSDKKTLMEGLQDKLNEINTDLSKQQGELREKEGELSEKEEERDNIMSSLNSIQGGDDDDESNHDIRSAETLHLPNTYEGIAPGTNDGTDETAQGIERAIDGTAQDIERDDQRTELLNEDIEQLNQEIEPLQIEVNRIQSKVSGLEEQFTQINTEIQEVGIATLEGTIQGQLGDIQTLTQELTELNKQGVSINNNITLLDPIVNELGKAIDTHKENFANKPNKLYEIEIKDFENDDVKAIDVLNADYIDIGLLYEDLAYMVGKTRTEIRTQDQVIPSESVTNTQAASQSDTDSDTVSISDINIVTAADNQPLPDEVKIDDMRPIEQGITQIPSNTSTNNDTFEIDDTTILTPNNQPLLEEVNIDEMSPIEQGITKIYLNDSDSDSDSDSDTVSIDNTTILTPTDNQPLLDDSLLTSSDTVTQGQPVIPNDSLFDIDTSYEDEEAFLHDAPPQLIEDLQFIEDKFNAYDEYKDITDRSFEIVKSIIKESILGPLQKLYTDAGLGDMRATLIITRLSNAIKKKDINTFLNMISDMKTNINDYYNTTDSNDQEEILKKLVKEIRQYSGGLVNRQKTKKQKPLRKNNSFRKKRKAKV